ncbi:MFS transporter [Porticoccaceae bacterium]|nr:MFS transporter [Porticoccaceae bacterium]
MTSRIDHCAADTSAPRQALSLQHQLLYALPSIGMVYFSIAVSVIQGVYAKYFGLALSSIAIILLVSRLFDVITDPLVGYFSDCVRARTGSRKPLIALGSLAIILSGYFLFVPVDPSLVNASTQVSGVYFAICYLAFYFSLTLCFIPHYAWGSELAKTGHEKTSIFALLAFANVIGAALFFVMPLLPWFDTTAITPESLQWTAIASAGLILPALYVSLKRVPDEPGKKAASAKLRPTKNALCHQATIFFSMLSNNKPLQLFLMIVLLSGLGLGIFTSMTFIFIDSFLGMGEAFSKLSLITLLVSACSLKFWYWLAVNHGKRISWALGGGITIIGLLAFMSLRPNDISFMHLLIVYSTVSFGLGSANMVPPALLSEIIDYSRWKYKVDCAGSIFSLYPLIGKFNFALGGSIGFFIVDWYGFEVTNAIHSSEAKFGLYLVVSGLPALLILLSLVFIYFMPITTRHHDIVRRRLEAENTVNKD